MKKDHAIEILCAYGIPQDEEEFKEALEMAIDALIGSSYRPSKYMMSIQETSKKDLVGKQLFVGTGMTENIVIETIKEHIKTRPFGGLEIRVYEEVQKEEIE